VNRKIETAGRVMDLAESCIVRDRLRKTRGAVLMQMFSRDAGVVVG
jgi:hypothetical protein